MLVYCLLQLGMIYILYFTLDKETDHYIPSIWQMPLSRGINIYLISTTELLRVKGLAQ